MQEGHVRYPRGCYQVEQALADYAELIERGMGESGTSALIALKRG